MDPNKNRFSVEKIEILDESTGEMIIKDINSTDSLLCKINQIDNHVYSNDNFTEVAEFDVSKVQDEKIIDNFKPNKRQKQNHIQLNSLIDKISRNTSFNDDYLKQNNFISSKNFNEKIQCDLSENYNSCLSSTSLSSPSSNEFDSSSLPNPPSTNSNCKSNQIVAFDLRTLFSKQAPNKEFSSSIDENNSILVQEMSKHPDTKFTPVTDSSSRNEKTNKTLDCFEFNSYNNNSNSSNYNNKSSLKNQNEIFSDFNFNSLEMTLSLQNGISNNTRASKDVATCQFCGRAMLKKNIPTHIRRAHTPKEELVCLNEEQNIFTFHHLKPGQRRKRSTRAYDYNLMTSNVSINEYDSCDEIENKFITEGQEILSSDLIHLADRIKYGIYQIPTNVLTKLIDILSKIECISNEDEIKESSKSIKNMISFYLISSEEFKNKVRQVGEDINERKVQVNSLRAELKEVMARKTQLERKIQPVLCDLQKLEDKHGHLIESELFESNSLLKFDIVNNNKNTKITT